MSACVTRKLANLVYYYLRRYSHFQYREIVILVFNDAPGFSSWNFGKPVLFGNLLPGLNKVNF